MRNIGSKAEAGSAALAFRTAASAARPLAAQIQQRRQHILFDSAEGGLGPYGNAGRRRAASQALQLVFQLQHHSFRGLLADAGNAHQLLHVSAANRVDDSGRRKAGQHLDGQRGPDAAHRDQFFEQRLLFRGEKAEQRERVFANVRVNAQRHLGARVGKRGKSRNRNHNVVADAGRIDDYLIRMFLKQLAAQEGDHVSGLLCGIPATSRESVGCRFSGA